MTEIKKSPRQILATLDKKLKEVYYSDSVIAIIQDAINLGQLDKDMKTMNILEEEIMNIILGRTALNSFQDNLKSRLNIQEANLLIVNKIIQDKIFDPVRNELEQLPINKPRLNLQRFSKIQPINTQTISETPIKTETPEIAKQLDIEKPDISGLKTTHSDIIKPRDKKIDNVQPITSSIPKYNSPEPIKGQIVKPIEIKQPIKESQSNINEEIKFKTSKEQKETTSPQLEKITEQPKITKTENIKLETEQKPVITQSNNIVLEKETIKKEEITKPQKATEAQPSIPEYNFPEPIKVQVVKPVNKVEELKKVTTPTTSSSKQDKIRNKLLEAMGKKDDELEIVKEIKNVLKSNINKKKEEKQEQEKEEQPKKNIIDEVEPSIILTGQGEEFKSKTPVQKSSEKKPYVLDVKLQEIKKEKQEKEFSSQPIKYQKYKKKSPFGEIS